MIDLLLRRTYIELSQIAWRFQPDTLRRRFLIVVLIQLQRWKIARLARSVAHLQTEVTQLKVKDLLDPR